MRVLIVYESLFGNTRKIAEAIAEGFERTRPDADVAVLAVDRATAGRVDQLDLLVVGGPTHILRMTTPRTRRQGLKPAGVRDGASDGRSGDQEPPLERADTHAAERGVREWLRALPDAPPGSRAAAFDTRFGSPVAGGAARSISRRLRDHGYQIVTEPKGFIVAGGEGPLKNGEHERARLWGVRLARLCSGEWLSAIAGDEGP